MPDPKPDADAEEVTPPESPVDRIIDHLRIFSGGSHGKLHKEAADRLAALQREVEAKDAENAALREQLQATKHELRQKNEFQGYAHARGCLALVPCDYCDEGCESAPCICTDPAYECDCVSLHEQLAEARADSERWDYAESHPQQFVDKLSRWWATAGEGCREEYFNLRGIADGIRRKDEAHTDA